MQGDVVKRRHLNQRLAKLQKIGWGLPHSKQAEQRDEEKLAHQHPKVEVNNPQTKRLQKD
ncbi:unnamed protein product [Ranitomeya imitator]|uniref:Uncharacterized protein n=1 Tax=Ranitomeya imitator TaxID=111125 RepID=A0ABN9LMX8_9NEOB|nr:unnamed protein product [Ranitomeya imitator]